MAAGQDDHISTTATLGGRPFAQRFHACAFFRSREEEHRVMSRFISEALAHREKVTYLVRAELREQLRQHLEAAGVNLQTYGALLDLQSWPATFDKERLLANLEELFATRAGGHAQQRAVGQADWLTDHMTDADELLEYEVRSTAIIERVKQPTVCCYQLDRIDAEMMMDLLRVHPLAVVGGTVFENPFFTPAAEMLEELRARRQRR